MAAFNHSSREPSNVILMGDIIEDSKVWSERVGDLVLRIGFLNKCEDEEERDFYRSNFDVVLEGDGDLTPVINWLC